MHHLTRTRGASLIAIIAFAVCATASAADLHVAPNGSDAKGDGSPQKPFATLQKAVIAVRNPESGVTNTILLAPGRYFTDTPITIDERDSGLTIRGIVKGATAEIYGGLPVTGWEKWKGDVWRAKVPVGTRFFNLVVDGRIATMAQWPNAGSGYGMPTIDKWDFADAQMFSWLGVNWFSAMGPVTAIGLLATRSPE